MMEEIYFARQYSAALLKDFQCGIGEMDEFIHHDLYFHLARHDSQLFTVHRAADNGVVAMFVLSEGYFFDDNYEIVGVPMGSKPFAVIDDTAGSMRIRYTTIEIEYLAVSKEYRDKHIGQTIIKSVEQIAVAQHTPFITVDAYFNLHYSAIPFYEKCGFIRLENQDRGYDTVRMMLSINRRR